MTEEASHKGDTGGEVVCPICEQPTVESDVCTRCGWVNFSSTRFQNVSPQPPAGMALDPRTGAFRQQRFWRKGPARYSIFLLGIFAAIAGEQLYKGFIETRELNYWWIAAAAAVLYLFAAVLQNRTEVRVSSDRLAVMRGPVALPFMDSFSLSRSEISRLDISRHVSSQDTTDIITCRIAVRTTTGQLYYVVEDGDEDGTYRLYAFLQKTLGTEQKVQQVTSEAKEAFFAAPASRVSQAYLFILAALAICDLPCFYLIDSWSFDFGFWKAYGLFTLAAFLVLYFHHRRYLNIWDSKPLRPGEQGANAVDYLILTPLLTLIYIPLIMELYLINKGRA